MSVVRLEQESPVVQIEDGNLDLLVAPNIAGIRVALAAAEMPEELRTRYEAMLTAFDSNDHHLRHEVQALELALRYSPLRLPQGHPTEADIVSAARTWITARADNHPDIAQILNQAIGERVLADAVAAQRDSVQLIQ